MPIKGPKKASITLNKYDHSKAMTKEERAEADKERLGRMAPAFALSYAEAEPTRRKRAARLKALLAIPESKRSPKEERELDGLMYHEIMVMAGVIDTPSPRGP